MQTALDWFLKCVRTDYANFNGRASREEFWYFVLVEFVLLIALGILTKIVFLFAFLEFLVALALIIPALAVTVRRLHDTNKPTVYVLLGFIPVVGLILLYWAILEGDPGPNEFGPPPSTTVAPATV